MGTWYTSIYLPVCVSDDRRAPGSVVDMVRYIGRSEALTWLVS